jgi:hypothetical protein
MLRFTLVIWSMLFCLRRLLVAHLAIINEGSPTPETARHIADVMLAQAFYGRLEQGEAAYYRFELAERAPVTLSMLVPQHRYAAGFRPTITLNGPGLPADGLVMPAEDKGTRMGTTFYQRTQQAAPTLPPGQYVLAVHADAAGVYCFCCGTREPTEYADEATRARAKALVESQGA